MEMPRQERRKLPIRQQKELENMRADLKNQKEQMETQKLLTRYVAEMSDIYIPEEEEEDVRNIAETEDQD